MSERHLYRSRRLRRRRARIRGLIALAVVAVVAIAGGLALARALTGGRGEAPAAARDTSSPTPAHSTPGDAGTTPAAEPPPAEPPPARIVSGGDVMTDRVVKSYIASYGAAAVLRGIAPQLRKGDAAWVNLESPLSTLGSPTPGKDYTFEGPPSMAKALAAAGVTVVTLGNNHTVDYGQAALADTIKRLEKAGVQVVGAGLDDEDAWTAAIVKTSGGATIGFLAWTDVLWPGYRATSKPGVAEGRTDIPRMKRSIRALAAEVDYVVVGYHWGLEYEHYPWGAQTSEAHAAIDAGADLVIGHHPHVLQGLETYKGRLIAYSLGDLVFDHYSIETGQTVLVDAVLTADGVKATLVPVYVSSSGIPAVQKGGAATTILSLVRQYSKALGTDVVIKGEVATVRAGKK
ncbi:MAG: CapA family protein [Actinobacteria bacterium]|nr:CapA family protein [Actinomycetota bacterium]